MREFNTSGPNIPKYHYTLIRKTLIEQGLRLVNNSRYFTIWAPRQTGKSTYFRQLAVELEKQGCKVAHINFESYKNTSVKNFLSRFTRHLQESWDENFTKENEIPFKIDRPSIKLLHTNGLIKDDGNGNVTFWVPFYKKRLYDAFYPYTNGEKTGILRSIEVNALFDNKGNIKFDELITGYKEYVKRRGFKVFMEKDENGKYKSIKESALVYSFETYLQAFLQIVKGKSYREADTGLGKSDLIINVKSKEYLVETKIYYYESQFLEGKNQLAYYCKSLGLSKGVYLVFCPTGIKYPESIKERKEIINGIEISTYLVEYDEDKW